MTALANDVKIVRYGSGDSAQPEAYPIGANQQLYSGDVALVSGSGSTTAGYLKATGTVGTADIVVGMVGDATGGAYSTGPGLPTNSADGGVWAEVLTGAFFFQSGTGGDTLSAATNGQTVYYGGSNANGPIACATNGSGANPVLGVQVPQDPGIAGGVTPGANYFPVIVAPLKGRS
jgi:hypothetical protein